MALQRFDWNQFFIPGNGISDVYVVAMVLSQAGSPLDLATYLAQVTGEGRAILLQQVRRLEYREILELRAQTHALLGVWTEILESFLSRYQAGSERISPPNGATEFGHMAGYRQLVKVNVGSLDEEEIDRVEKKTVQAKGQRRGQPLPVESPMGEDTPYGEPVRRSLEWSRKRVPDSPWDKDVPRDYVVNRARELATVDKMEISPLRLQWVAGAPLGEAPQWRETGVTVEGFQVSDGFPAQQPALKKYRVTEEDLERTKEEWREALLLWYRHQQEINVHAENDRNSLRTGCVAMAAHYEKFCGHVENKFASLAEMQRELANAMGSAFRTLNALTNETPPAFSSGMDAALQNLAVTVQKALQPLITDVAKLAENIAELEYRGERLPSWVSEEVSRQMIPLAGENRSLRKALEQEAARNADMERKLREYLSQRDVAQQEQLQGVTAELSTKNAHLYGAFVDVTRRLEELQVSQ